MLHSTIAFVLLLFITASAAGQSPSPTKAGEDEARNRTEAIELLRETASEVGRLRTIENRISFSSELASLMWFHDDKEARAMYGAVVSDFRQLLMQFDWQMNADEDDEGGMFGRFGVSKTQRKFNTAMTVRKQIALSLAEHAPDLAYNFFYDTLSLISNAEMRKETEQSDKHFELQLMKQIAESNAAKAVEYGKESIKAGLSMGHVELLRKIYEKDPDQGVEYGTVVLSRLKSGRSETIDPGVYSSLLEFGSSNLEASKKPGGKKAVYTSNDLRDIADQFAGILLATKDEGEIYMASSYAEQIEKYSPARGAQIKAKYKPKNSVISNSAYGGNSTVVTSNSNSNSNSASTPANDESEAREKAQQKMMEDVKGLGAKSLPREQRDKIVADARKVISTTKGKDKKILALSLLAAQVARSGDQELADEIMGDAERFVNPQPKNYQDFTYSLMLASGYAEANPAKAFPLLDNTILRVNETISAAVKMAEFIDVNDEYVVDGEVQVGMFGGSMIREMTRELGTATDTLGSLIRADFAKTKNLANSFDRTEMRVLAKMMLLRTILEKRSKDAAEDPIMLGRGK